MGTVPLILREGAGGGSTTGPSAEPDQKYHQKLRFRVCDARAPFRSFFAQRLPVLAPLSFTDNISRYRYVTSCTNIGTNTSI